jgi:GntR family transcriptional regulator/MocR family aminotransferase
VRLTPFVLVRESVKPLYQQLFEQLQARILSGELPAGARLPSSRALAAELGIARISVTAAFDALENGGLVISKERRGLFVAERPNSSHKLGNAFPLHDGDFASTSFPQATPDRISFSAGSLPTEFLPVEAMRRALNIVLDRDAGAALGYEPTEGYHPLRVGIARQVGRLGIQASADQVLVTGGCQQAIDLAVQSIVPPGGTLLTTDPTYIGLIDIARARGITLLTVPYDAEGLDFAELDRLVAQEKPHLFYLMTTFHNPTGAVMSIPTRRRLLAWANANEIPLLEDGVYDGLIYSTENQFQSLKALDETGIVLYASGFSKTVVPGTRIGYLITSPRYFERLRAVKQAADVCTPGLNQRAMAVLLESGALEGHLEQVRRVCQRRRDALLAALQPMRAQGWQFGIPQGGLYLWLLLPEVGIDAPMLLRVALEHRVDFAPGIDFSPARRWSHALRLNFTSYPPTLLTEGVARLIAAYRQVA